MAVECYALVVFKKPLDVEEKEWNRLLKAVHRQDDISVPLQADEIEYHFCHLKLVQPIPKGKSQPKPKWEIVRDWGIIADQTIRFLDREHPAPSTRRWELLVQELSRRNTPVPDSTSMVFFPSEEPIGDRRIQLSQIRYLFPETATMPLAIALDYVRDRI